VGVGKDDRVTFRSTSDDRSAAAYATNRDPNRSPNDLIESVTCDAIGSCSWGFIHQLQVFSKWIKNDRALDLASLANPIDADFFLGERQGGHANSHQKNQRQTFGFHSDSCD
jgi:hypothetical protein